MTNGVTTAFVRALLDGTGPAESTSELVSRTEPDASRTRPDSFATFTVPEAIVSRFVIREASLHLVIRGGRLLASSFWGGHLLIRHSGFHRRSSRRWPGNDGKLELLRTYFAPAAKTGLASDCVKSQPNGSLSHLLGFALLSPTCTPTSGVFDAWDGVSAL